MANPQLEDGRTEIANEIVTALARVNLSAYESRILWCIFRKTYGWHKKLDQISYSQFEESTNMDRRHIGRTLKLLVARHMITCQGVGQQLEYSIQKDYEQWCDVRQVDIAPLPKEAMVEIDTTIASLGNSKTINNHCLIRGELLPNQGELLPKEATKLLPKEANTKAYKASTKAYYKSREATANFENYQKELRGRFTDLNFDLELEKFTLYWNDGHRKLKNPKLGLLNWLTKAREIKAKGGNGNGKYGTIERRARALPDRDAYTDPASLRT